MAIKPLFKISDIRAGLNAKIEKIEKVHEAKLSRIGNKFVRDARIKADFTDRTGNLRSSIGFILVKDGKVITEDFEQSIKNTQGQVKAIEYAMGLADRYVFGYTLIVVAGMEYAAAVESKGYDVLTGSSLEATAALNKYFKRK